MACPPINEFLPVGLTFREFDWASFYFFAFLCMMQLSAIEPEPTPYNDGFQFITRHKRS